jgi:hypothetical protein
MNRVNSVLEDDPPPLNQDWFWSRRWQQMEREADLDIAMGRIRIFASLEQFLDGLNS